MKNRKKMTAVDIIVITIILCFAIAGVIFISTVKPSGSKVNVYVDGELYESVSLYGEEPVDINVNGTNIVTVRDGAVYMKWADCDNQDCVNHKEISNEDEEIICLPNKVEVKIISEVGAEDVAW